MTLGDLLAAAALLALLLALLLPALADARGDARRRTCAANERQILLAVAQYAQDSDGMLPRLNAGAFVADHDARPRDQQAGLENALEPYLHAGAPWGPERTDTVWHCPEDTLARDDCSGGPGVGVGYDISYGFSYYADTPDPGADPRRTFGVFARAEGVDSRTQAQIGVPGDTVVLYELYTPDNYARFRAQYRRNNADVASPDSPCGHTPHSDV